jgi:hypothetical protein
MSCVPGRLNDHLEYAAELWESLRSNFFADQLAICQRADYLTLWD